MPVTHRDVDYLEARFQQFVFVEGASMLFVGDSPSQADLKEGVCFSGTGAMALAKSCAAFGIDYSKAHKAVALDYWPSNGDGFGVVCQSKNEAERRGLYSWGKYWIDKRTLASFNKLLDFIDRCKPEKILVLGNLALYCLLLEDSISAWRGSRLQYVSTSGHKSNLMPTFHPSALSRKKSWRIPFCRDLQMFAKGNFEEPPFNFLIGGSFLEYKDALEQLLTKLDKGRLRLAIDVETRKGYITVLGVAWSKLDAIVIPFVQIYNGNNGYNYFSVEEEFILIKLFDKVVKHPNAYRGGQNFQYDKQYMTARYGINIPIDWDTMVDAHTIWTKGLELGLSYLASLYCEWYRYWKEDGKDFHASFKTEEDQIKYWRYNGYDCCYTWEVAEALDEHWNGESEIRKEFHAFQRVMQELVVQPVIRGISFDHALQKKMLKETLEIKAQYEAWFEYMIPNELCDAGGKSPWWDSPTKLSHLMYKQFGIQPVIDKKTKRPSTGGDAPSIIGQREPLFKRIMEKLDEYRSINQFISLYLTAEASPEDGRMRTQYMLPGTDTFRLASKKDAFGYGMNLQNVTKG